MVCLVSLLLICLFSTKQAQWKIFLHAWEGLWPTTASCFQEMSVHTHICVKLLFPAQTVFSVASNWAHMYCALYHYMLGSIRWLVPTDAISERDKLVQGKQSRQAPLALWFYSWLLELNREVLDFWHSEDIKGSAESDFFFSFKDAEAISHNVPRSLWTIKQPLKDPSLTHCLSLSPSLFKLSRAIKTKLMSVCHFGAVTIRIKYIRQHAWKWWAARTEETEHPDSSKRLDQADRRSPASERKRSTHPTELRQEVTPQPLTNRRPQMVSSLYNRELLILSQPLSNCNIP